MYRQILIANEDRLYQCIFWRESPNDSLKVYTLNTVTYGTISAPYLAIKAIKQLCTDEKHNYPKAAKIAEEHFYVDDLLAGSDSIESAKSLVDELQLLMSSGGFELRKWASSHPDIISHLPENLKATNFTHSFNEDNSQKVLGLYWDLTMDTFQVRAVQADKISTKRQLLSVIARTFDPLGFVSPSTIMLKILMQDVWKAKIGWDEQLPIEILNSWNKFHEEIHYFKEIKIPRYIDNLHSSNFEVHGFCDASLKAYAAVLYIRVISDSTKIFLAAAKTRVAPVQSSTLPRLELCGALLLSQLLNKFKESVSCPIHKIFLWSDSTITLNWINNPPTKGNQFVLHRANKINFLTNKNQWHHIPGKSNIADCASRGISPKQLLENHEWFHGPNWLYDFDPNLLSTNNSIRHSPESLNNTEFTLNDTISLTTQIHEPLDFINRFSEYLKLLRTVAWILRFYNNSRNKLKYTGPLKSFELKKSTKVIVKFVQSSEFQSEIKLLNTQKSLPKTSKLLPLNPFIDTDGILRIGGRLRHQQELTFDQKFPMLLPKNHHLTILILRHYHRLNLHAGQELVLSSIRQLFWIPDGKSTVKKELRKCVRCCKNFARPISQLMGDLPHARIHPSRVFSHVAVDFAGPIMTKCQHSRKSSNFKSYLCVFVCMSTKAIHLEAVSSLTTSAFLATFRRFVARRGYPSDVYSDNGLNFVGAASYLRSLFKLPQDKSIIDYSSQRNIKWHFIPPYTPNFGGLWEAAVKLTKRHLLNSCNAALLNFEELATLLCQVEACLNSRPLYPLSDDPNDLQALTPGHFLIGCPLIELPDSSTNLSFLSSHSRWSLVQQLKDEFWKRWKTSYLNTLQSRTKKGYANQVLNINDLVLVKDPTTIATTWNLGRILEIHPGSDNIIRVVTVRTAKGPLKRPVSQIFKLPLDEKDSLPPGPSMLDS